MDTGEAVAARPGARGARARRAAPVRWDVLAVVAVGGALGAAARHGAALAWPRTDLGFPGSTFVVNATGCLLLGLLMAFVVEVRPSSRYVRPLLGVGVLGGYTTFSTYALETRALFAAGAEQAALLYLGGSLVAGLAAVWLGGVGGVLVLRVMHRRHG